LIPVAALFVATVSVITTQSIVPGLLPQLAADLGVDIPTAGMLITGYALAMVVAGPVLALVTGGVPRKRLLLAALSVFVLGNVLSALASGYIMLLAARIVVACGHGLVFGLATVMAMQLAPEDRKASAVSLVVAGSTVASIAGIPLGIVIGDAYGWRTTFGVLATAGALAWLAGWLMIPASGRQPEQSANLATQLRAASRPDVLIGYSVFGFYMLGNMSIYSYIVPLLTQVSGIPAVMVPWVIAGMGLSGFVGNLVGGRLADRRPMETLVCILLAIGTVSLVMSLLTGSPWGMVVALWTRWLIGFGFPAPLRATVIRHAGAAPTLAATLTTTAGNMGTASAAALGAAAIAGGWGYASLPLISALATALSLLALLVLWARDRRLRPAGV
jgi:DHA1 family inner membrane transport protein